MLAVGRAACKQVVKLENRRAGGARGSERTPEQHQPVAWFWCIADADWPGQGREADPGYTDGPAVISPLSLCYKYQEFLGPFFGLFFPRCAYMKVFQLLMSCRWSRHDTCSFLAREAPPRGSIRPTIFLWSTWKSYWQYPSRLHFTLRLPHRQFIAHRYLHVSSLCRRSVVGFENKWHAWVIREGMREEHSPGDKLILRVIRLKPLLHKKELSREHSPVTKTNRRQINIGINELGNSGDNTGG